MVYTHSSTLESKCAKETTKIQNLEAMTADERTRGTEKPLSATRKQDAKEKEASASSTLVNDKASRGSIADDSGRYFGPSPTKNLPAEKYTSFVKLAGQYEFQKLALYEEPVLRIFDPRLEIEVYTDALMDGYSAVLMRKCAKDGMMHPCFYFSRATTDVERKCRGYDLEVIAVVYAAKKFRSYLFGRSFKIVTNCIAFKQTINKKEVNNRARR
ncbi:uncharacterized protein LOC117176649 [Belonocnema kinseyi]|uniref:uncharacterized protein LOC117176649 n=1 Tax=Belonocnema kinseyi TaxID=2817044 RepID=UPI00143DC8A8|nr:uncharacterized protein LOC117176649 [Belonocnema kinseyi]